MTDDIFYRRLKDASRDLPDVTLPPSYSYSIWRPSLFNVYPPFMRHLRTLPLCWMRSLLHRGVYFRALQIFHDGGLAHCSMIRPLDWRLPYRMPPSGFGREDLEVCYVWTHPSHRSRGLATAGCALLLRQLEPRVPVSVWYNVKIDNLSSRAVAERLGFTPAFRGVNAKFLSLYTFYREFHEA